MARNNNLGDLLTDIAVAIRAKKETEGVINAQDFPEEISSIETMPAEIREVVKDISGVESGDGVVMANAIAKSYADEPTEGSFISRVTAEGASIHDGVAFVDKVKGKTVKWNQLMRNSIFKNGKDNWIGTFQIVDNVAVIPCDGGGTRYIVQEYPSFPIGHKVLTIAEVKAESEDMSKAIYVTRILTADTSIPLFTHMLTTEYSVFADIQPITAPVTQIQVRSLVSDFEGTLYCRRITAIDLTAMFGAGNEPSTYEEFLARGVEVSDPYAYDEGSLVSMTADKIVSKDGDGETLAELPLGIADIKDGEGNPLFPYGLLSAGDVRDEIDLAAGKAIKRIDIVNFGKLVATGFDSQDKIMMVSHMTPQKFPDYGNGQRPNAIATSIGVVYSLENLRSVDTSFGFCIFGHYIYVKNTSLEHSVVAYNAWFNSIGDVVIAIELATPIVVDLAPRKAFYKVQNNGTEEINAEGQTAPITADIAYRGLSAEALVNSLANIQNQ